jgi:hypothetical protein
VNELCTHPQVPRSYHPWNYPNHGRAVSPTDDTIRRLQSVWSTTDDPARVDATQIASPTNDVKRELRWLSL